MKIQVTFLSNVFDADIIWNEHYKNYFFTKNSIHTLNNNMIVFTLFQLLSKNLLEQKNVHKVFINILVCPLTFHGYTCTLILSFFKLLLTTYFPLYCIIHVYQNTHSFQYALLKFVNWHSFNFCNYKLAPIIYAYYWTLCQQITSILNTYWPYEHFSSITYLWFNLVVIYMSYIQILV